MHKDDKQNKLTFVGYYGIESARKLAEKLISDAINEISFFGDKAENLKLLAQYIIDREY